MFDSAEIAFSLMGIRQYGVNIDLHLACSQNSGINVLFSYIVKSVFEGCHTSLCKAVL